MGKIASIDAEVIDATLDYNLLLGRTLFYAMKFVASTIFWLLSFPQQGRIVTINQLDYCMPDLHPNANTIVPLITDFTSQFIGVGMFKDPCIMGVFPLSTPDLPKLAHINMISYVDSYDPWVTPCPSEIESQLSYFVIKSTNEFVDRIYGTSSIKELDMYFFPQWAQPLSLSHDFLNYTLPSDEAILEVMTLFDRP